MSVAKRAKRVAEAATTTPAASAAASNAAGAAGAAAAAAEGDASPSCVLASVVGRTVRKKWPGAGVFSGSVRAPHHAKEGHYVVLWEDGAETVMKDTAISRIIVE